MNAQSLVAELGQQSGTRLQLSANGTAALAFEGGPKINLEHDASNNILHLYVVLGTLPAEPASRAALCQSLLAANLFGRDTEGAAFGLDEVSGEIILARGIKPEACSVQELQQHLSAMVGVAKHWQQRLQPGTQAEAAFGSDALAHNLRV